MVGCRRSEPLASVLAVLQASGQLTGEWDMGGALQMYPSAARRTGQLCDLVQVPWQLLCRWNFSQNCTPLGFVLAQFTGQEVLAPVPAVAPPLEVDLPPPLGLGLPLLLPDFPGSPLPFPLFEPELLAALPGPAPLPGLQVALAPPVQFLGLLLRAWPVAGLFQVLLLPVAVLVGVEWHFSYTSRCQNRVSALTNARACLMVFPSYIWSSTVSHVFCSAARRTPGEGAGFLDPISGPVIQE